MDFSSYFASLLENSFSYLQVNASDQDDRSDVTEHFISNSDNVSIGFGDENPNLNSTELYAHSDDGGTLSTRAVSNIIAVLNGDKPATITLINTINFKVETGAGTTSSTLNRGLMRCPQLVWKSVQVTVTI